MSKDTRLKRTVNRAIERRLAQERERQKPHTLKFVLTMLGFVIGIPGILVGILSLLPRASVTPNDPLNPDDPFSAPFVVSNDGYVELNDVQFSCSPMKVETKNFWVIDTVPGKEPGGVRETSLDVGTLGRDGSTTVRCAISPAFANILPLESAHRRITISFRPEWLPWRRTMTMDFILAKDTGNRFHWLHRSF
jgi:hypothetical protein